MEQIRKDHRQIIDGILITYFVIVNKKTSKKNDLFALNEYPSYLSFKEDTIASKVYDDTSEIDESIELSSIDIDDYEEKEKEWIKLVGKEEFLSLDKKSRDFLINTAGIIDLGYFDINKTYNYSIYDDKE